MNVVSLIRKAVSGAVFGNIGSAIAKESNLARHVTVGSRIANRPECIGGKHEGDFKEW